ncbi:hypothetical protein BH11PLA1_BH11PLA1_22450 [soil metagenome]
MYVGVTELQPIAGLLADFAAASRGVRDEVMALPGYVTAERFARRGECGGMLVITGWENARAFARYRDHLVTTHAEMNLRLLARGRLRAGRLSMLGEAPAHAEEDAPVTLGCLVLSFGPTARLRLPGGAAAAASRDPACGVLYDSMYEPGKSLHLCVVGSCEDGAAAGDLRRGGATEVKALVVESDEVFVDAQ